MAVTLGCRFGIASIRSHAIGTKAMQGNLHGVDMRATRIIKQI